jgi:hypothetical protein
MTGLGSGGVMTPCPGGGAISCGVIPCGAVSCGVFAAGIVGSPGGCVVTLAHPANSNSSAEMKDLNI